MKEKSARPACRVENPLFDRPLHSLTDNLGCQPIRRVILAQPVTLLAVDQRLIEDFQHIAFDLIQAEAPHVRENSADKGLALRLRDHPVEEVALCRAENPGRLEGGS